MKILQRDIFGTAQLVEEASMDRKPHAASTASKKFPDININSGVDEWQAAGDAMLIHRALQRKMIWSNLRTKRQAKILMKLVENEMLIKAGLMDPATASRDSLLLFYC